LQGIAIDANVGFSVGLVVWHYLQTCLLTHGFSAKFWHKYFAINRFL
jgi:hypothetical protein